jgi:hypothetical protein
MKRVVKILVWSTALVAGLLVGLTCYPFIFYRLTSGETIRFEREVRYQVIDFGQNGGLRWYFEKERGNSRLFLAPEDSTPSWVYVSSDDFRKCWSVPLSEMIRDTFTVVAVLEASRLLLVSGYSPSKVMETKRIKKHPVTSK